MGLGLGMGAAAGAVGEGVLVGVGVRTEVGSVETEEGVGAGAAASRRFNRDLKKENIIHEQVQVSRIEGGQDYHSTKARLNVGRTGQQGGRTARRLVQRLERGQTHQLRQTREGIVKYKLNKKSSDDGSMHAQTRAPPRTRNSTATTANPFESRIILVLVVFEFLFTKVEVALRIYRELSDAS